MPASRHRALVLGAGLGTRLRPLTHHLPKPLMPVAGQPLLTHTLDALVESGCEAVAINLHHLGAAIRRTLGDHYRGLPITYSEEPAILGTLGALAPLKEFFDGADEILVINGDSLCAWPLAELLAEHRRNEADATLLVSSTADPGRYGGGVGVAADGRVVALRGLEVEPPATHRVFTGAQVLAPWLLAGAEHRPRDLVADLYQPLLLAQARLRAFATTRPWHDLGSPRWYRDGVLDWLERRENSRWISSNATVDPGAEVRLSAVEDNACVGPGAIIERSLLLPGARVGSFARVVGSIVGFGADVPAGTVLESRLLMADDGSGRGSAL